MTSNAKTNSDPTATVRGCDKLSKSLGLVRGKGTFNGAAYWKRPNSNAIITRNRLLELAGY